MISNSLLFRVRKMNVISASKTACLSPLSIIANSYEVFSPTKLDTDLSYKNNIIRHVNNGGSVEGATEYDSVFEMHELYQFKGLVYRSEVELRDVSIEGFKSKNDLLDQKNYQESTGIGVDDKNSVERIAVGATGQSGVSTAKKYSNCQGYGDYHYVIDTRLFPPEYKAFDLEMNMTMNSLSYDDSSEVNVTHIPNYAIIGVFQGDAVHEIKSLPEYWASICWDDTIGEALKESMVKNYNADHKHTIR